MQTFLDTLDALVETAPVIIAIDGPCAAGKTTFAERLSSRYDDARVFHMDDFFLQPKMRSPERLQTPGGNVDHERFQSEVLIPLTRREPFTYHKYNCQTDALTPVAVEPARLSIVEGAYSLHPSLRDYYDLRVFLDVDEDTQAKRILIRNSPDMAQRFFSEWIPLEQAYFRAMRVREAADFVLSPV